MRKLLTILFALLLSVQGINAVENQLAFPGAEGYGKYVTGGRGGEVCYVTRLDDCTDANLVPGTLRWALRHNNGGKPRTVLFNVSGTIYLTSKLKLEYPNVSILGQSAPGGGICLSGFNMYICKNNVIVRYIRFRAGDIPNSSMTGLDIENCDGVILDHCSMTWSMEECLTAYDTDYTTVQWCIIGEGLYSSKNAKGARAYATQWGGEHSSMHHTLITNSHSRSPRFNGVRSSSKNKGEHDYQVDSEFANNVVFNWSATGAIYGGEYAKTTVEVADWTKTDPGYNRVYMINNYYKPGPSTKKNGTQAMFASPSAPFGEWYLSGNKFEETGTYCPWSQASAQAANSNNYAALNASGCNILTSLPYALSGMTYETAEQAYANVTTKAGASLPRYDEVDRRLLDEAAGKVVPKYTGSLGDLGIIDAPDNVKLSNPGVYYADGVAYNNYPSLAMKSGDKYMIDSDCDGLPDAYEDEKGLNKNNAADGAAVAANGYTNLENYLNAIADGSINKAKYETSSVPVKPGTSTVPETVTVTFRCTDTSVQGTSSFTMTVKYGETITIPQNKTMFKNGYTLTSWQGGGYKLGVGADFMPLEDVVLTPVFTQNTVSLAQRTEPVVAIWKDGKDETAAIIVTQAKVNGAAIDVALQKADGKVLGYSYEKENGEIGNDIVVVFPYSKSSQGLSGSGEGSLTWTWAGLTGADVAEKADIVTPDGAFLSTKATVTGFTTGSKTVSSKNCVALTPSGNKVTTFSVYAKCYLEFTITPAEGMKFQATKVTWNGATSGADGGTYGVVTQVGTEALKQQKSTIAPSKDVLKAFSQDLTKTSLSDQPTKVRIYIYNLDPGKQAVIRDIVITGTYEGESSGSVQYAVKALPYNEGSGTATMDPAEDAFTAGKAVTLTATPASGYLFEKWIAADGKELGTASTISMEVTKSTIAYAVMKALSDYNYIYENCAPYDAAVRNVNELKLALDKAAKRSDLNKRYRIFLFNGTYDFGKTAKTAVVQNTSLIGESQNGVLLMNNPGAVSNYQEETPVLFIDQNQNNVYMQDLTIRQARDWDSKKSAGQAVALRQRGKFAAYKNVTMQGVQDTYYINKADASAYFEDCTLAGEVDFIYGDGTLFFQNCKLNPISANAVIAASNAQPGYMGMVFNDCTIEGASGYALGRPWNDSPAVTYINTTMKQLPQAAGWKSMTSGLVLRLHEYGSKDANGAALDLSQRSLSACGAAAGSDPCVITAEQARDYTVEKTFEKFSWNPTALTKQVVMAKAKLNGNALTWAAAPGAIGYAVQKDGKVIAFTKATGFVTDGTGTYIVRPINEMGGLGLVDNTAIVGDVNGDGSVTAKDAELIVDFYLGKNPQNFNRAAADLNGDGKITVADANVIVNVK